MQSPKINCPVFQKHEPKIKVSTNMINKAKDPYGKIKYAEELLEEAGELLDCPDYKEADLICSNCRAITNLRKSTAELIIKSKKLL